MHPAGECVPITWKESCPYRPDSPLHCNRLSHWYGSAIAPPPEVTLYHSICKTRDFQGQLSPVHIGPQLDSRTGARNNSRLRCSQCLRLVQGCHPLFQADVPSSIANSRRTPNGGLMHIEFSLFANKEGRTSIEGCVRYNRFRCRQWPGSYRGCRQSDRIPCFRHLPQTGISHSPGNHP